MLDIPATLQEKRNSPLPCRHNTPACGSPVQTRPQRPEAACQDCASPHFYYDQAKTTGPTPGVPSTTWMLPTCRLPSGRKESDGETSAAFGSTTSDNFSAVLGAHALPKSMFPLALEIRRLFKSERHCALLVERSFFNEEAAL